jgi:hypothetical protein
MHTRITTRTTTIILATAILLALAPAVPTRAADAADVIKPDKPIELFDGQNIDNWRVVAVPKDKSADACWQISDGVLHATGAVTSVLYSRQSYRDYRLAFQWRWAGPAPVDNNGNVRRRDSGVFIHAQGETAWWPKSLEAQIKDKETGDFYLIGGVETNEWRALEKKNRHLPKTSAVSEKPSGEWNACEIICRGDTVIYMVNGVEQNRATGVSVTSGGIALQYMAPNFIDFRNIRLTPL